MPLKLIETDLKDVSTELRNHYVKQANGHYKLDVDGLDSQLSTLKSTIAKLTLKEALNKADVLPNYVHLFVSRLADRVAIEADGGKTVVRIVPVASDGNPDGATTIERLVSGAAEEFPFLFNGKAVEPEPGPKRLLPRAEFDALSPKERAAKMADGYQLVDDKASSGPSTRSELRGKQIFRAEFDALSPKERAAKMADGYQLVDDGD